jgi:GDP-mannose 4,6-dehydratase
MYKKTAIITGISGQDGAYLSKLLLRKGYKVYGTYRRTSSVNFWRIEELGISEHPDLHLVEFDLTDLGTCIRLLHSTGATEIYNLAAQSFVGVSFDQPHTTAQITGVGALNLLEAIRLVNPQIRFYQASTSEMFGKVQAIPQVEETPFWPRSPNGGAYISRMSNYCKGCEYNPKLRIGETACPFTTLYWDFLDRHKETFAKNHRMSQQIFGLNRLSDLPELKIRAQEVLSGLEKGTI